MEIVVRSEKVCPTFNFNSHVRVEKRTDDPEVLSSALSAIKIKHEDVGVSVDETEFVAVLMTAAPKDYFSSITTWKGPLEEDKFPITVKEIVKEMTDLYQMQHVTNVKLESDDGGGGEVTLTNVDKNFKRKK